MGVTILGISPCTRPMGLAIIEKGDLVDYQVKTFKGTWSMKKRTQIVRTVIEMVEYFQVAHVALRTLHPLMRTEELKELMLWLTKALEECKVEVRRYSTDQVKAYCKRVYGRDISILNFFGERLPELRKEYLKERNSFYPYYIKMFEAIVAGLILNQERRQKQIAKYSTS